MDTATIAYIGILFIAAVLVWALVRSNVTIANLIPAPLAQELIKSSVQTALAMAEERAATTETKVDDELVKLVRSEINKLLVAAQPPSPATVTGVASTGTWVTVPASSATWKIGDDLADPNAPPVGING